MGLKQNFVQNLKKIRKIEGISQMKLAELCETDVSYIGQIEMGIRFPSINLIEKIGQALEVEPYRFFMDESGDKYGNLESADDLLIKLPKRLRLDLMNRLNTAINDCVKETLNP
ncbi:helix-turn-helix domain-containing protein [Treponema primitia]|uniref:helix-turn-helix domain-containing protein n=1 Tax=Treponema primitia TaxID=88058 RepID=UPI00397FE39D